MEKRTADVNYACACSRARVPGRGEMRMEEPTEKARERERERKEGQNGDGTPGYPPRVNQFREHRACVCARVRADVNVCREAYPPVRAWNGRERRAVSAPHPESPFETNPTHRDETPAFPLRVRGSFP